MYRTLLIFAAVVACVNANILPPEAPSTPDLKLDGRIVGGHDISIKQAPYQVSVRELNYHICGGSIMNRRAILTAAHCFNAPTYYYNIQYGVTNCGGYDNVIWPNKIVKHKLYNGGTHDYDVALIFLDKDILFSDVAKPISLSYTNPPEYARVVVTGWGALYEGGHGSGVLQSVDLSVKSDAVCASQYKKDNQILTDRMLCAGYYGGGRDACQLDSGGPLTWYGTQVGVVSFGVGCARPEFFGIYSSVAELRPWIEKLLNSN